MLKQVVDIPVVTLVHVDSTLGSGGFSLYSRDEGMATPALLQNSSLTLGMGY